MRGEVKADEKCGRRVQVGEKSENKESKLYMITAAGIQETDVRWARNRHEVGRKGQV